MNDYNQRIRERREQLNMTQEELAFKVGYNTRSSIARIERGDIDLKRARLEKIAVALNVSPLWIMTGKTDSNAEDLQATIKILTQTLTDEQKQKVIDFVQYLRYQEKEMT